MERRALLAAVISLFILFASDWLLKTYYAPGPGSLPVEAPLAQVTPPETRPAEVPAGAEAPVPEPVSPVVPAPVPEGREVVVETDLYRAVFTTAGGRLKSFQAKRYRATIAPDSPPLELVSTHAAADLPLGLHLRGRTSETDAAVVYSVDRETLDLTAGGEGAITFSGTLNGMTLSKRIRARSGAYLFDVEVRASGVRAEYTEMGIGWNHGFNAEPAGGREIVFDNVLALQANKRVQEAPAKLDAGKLLEGDIRWLGHSGRYFFAALIPPGAEDATNKIRAWFKRRGGIVETTLLLPPGQFGATLHAYIGPKDIDVLEASGFALRRAVDLGWFTFVALPLLYVLKMFYRVTGNHGVDIILLTVIIKILFIPLTSKSMRSMKAMQALQPELTRLRERYKDKPEELNRQMMEMYRRHKVNPFGGCIPMVLQIPVFVGLYNALMNAVELRHAPFFAWITDLSAPDRLGSLKIPYVDPPGFPVLTLAMGASMLVQQWMTPATGDPAQQRMMMIMPVMFTFMFIGFPSGLTLYWLVNNILTIAQQYAMNRSAKA